MRATFKGSIVSPDPRLTGDVELRARVLHNDATEYGTAEGIFLVRDSGTHTVKVRADLYAVESPGVPGVHGFILGHVTEDGSRLLANSSGDVEQGVTTGQLGGTSSGGQTPAVIQSGRCTGPFENLPVARALRRREGRLGGPLPPASALQKATDTTSAT